MKLYHCKKCGTFIGPYGFDVLCPTCRRKETYLTKEEVVAMLTEVLDNVEEVQTAPKVINNETADAICADIAEILRAKINKLKGEEK